MGYVIRTAALMLVLTLLFIGIGLILWHFLFDGTTKSLYILMAFFVGFSVLVNMFAYFFSKSIILRAHKVKIITRDENPRLYGIVEKIAMTARLPMPQVGITNTTTPNAFATGRNPKNAVVVATAGLLDLLDDNELKGVMAHEMAHVKDRDILIMSIAACIAGAISILSRFAIFGAFGRRQDAASAAVLVLAYLTIPIAAMLIQLGISRGREYKADEVGARMTNDPLALASALDKLENGNINDPFKHENLSSAHLWIANPLRKEIRNGFAVQHSPAGSGENKQTQQNGRKDIRKVKKWSTYRHWH